MTTSSPSPGASRDVSCPLLGRILIVDDEERLAFAHRRFLVAQGYEVESVRDAAAAMRALDELRFDAVISEIAMRGTTSSELLAAVRERHPDIPFLVLTATATIETAARALEEGALRYLVKPVSMPELLRAAEAAMTAARAARRQRRATVIADLHDEEEATRSERVGHLARAIDAVYMAYQPIVSWRLRQPIGYEALARSSDARLARPDALFAEAERFGQLQQLGRIIRGQVLSVAEALAEGTRLFVNLHVSDLEDTALYDAIAPLSRVASRVVLEITERGSIASVPDLEKKVASLRALGYRVALDDIGAGYANLNSLTTLEPDIVKLDMSLVRDIHERGTKQRVVSALVELCRDMQIELIAEGVETKSELDALLALGCDLFQGYFFARPGPFAG